MAQPITLTMDGLLLNWLKEVGDSVQAGDIVAEFEADKATVEVEAPADGVILSLDAEPGDELSEGAVIAQLGGAGENASAPAEAKQEAVSTPAPSQTASSNGAGATTTADGRVKVSPVARNIADEKGINLAQVTGTGPGGRITKADVENFTPSSAPTTSSASAPATGGAVEGRQSYGTLPEASEDVEIIDVSRMRKAIAGGTTRSMQTTPHFYVTVEIDVEALLALRKELNVGLADDGVKISVNDMMIKAAALTLRKFPNLNTHYYGDKLVRYKNINIGVAVALPDNGLANVVLHNADKVALSELATTAKTIYGRAREGKIKADDLKGATFTISNLGPYNVESFSAIISTPESGMIAISSSRRVPVVLEDGTLGVGTRMKATLSIDHRVSDGAEGAQFMNLFRDLIENPMRLLV